jgi:hypothetical protein
VAAVISRSTTVHTKGRAPWKAVAVVTGLAALPFAVPGLLLFLYAFFVFRPQLPAVHQLLQQAAPAERTPSPRLRQLLHLSLDGAVAPQAARLVLQRLYPGERSGHGRHALWTWLLAQNLSAQDMDALYCALAYNGADHGLERLAWRRFGRSLRDLDDTQAATVLLVLDAPTLYARRPERLQRLRAQLLRRATTPTDAP